MARFVDWLMQRLIIQAHRIMQQAVVYILENRLKLNEIGAGLVLVDRS